MYNCLIFVTTHVDKINTNLITTFKITLQNIKIPLLNWRNPVV